MPHCLPVHRLILITHKGPPPKGTECCHGPRGNLDNRLSNLSWGTKKKNNGEDKIRDGTHNRGERNCQAKLSKSQIRVIRRLCEFGIYQRRIAAAFGVSQSMISYIANNVKWAHI